MLLPVFILCSAILLVYMRVEYRIGADADSSIEVAQIGLRSVWSSNQPYAIFLNQLYHFFGLYGAFFVALIVNYSLVYLLAKLSKVDFSIIATVWFLLFFLSFQIGKQASGLTMLICAFIVYIENRKTKLFLICLVPFLHISGALFSLFYILANCSKYVISNFSISKCLIITILGLCIGLNFSLMNLIVLFDFLEPMFLMNLSKAEIYISRMQNVGGEYYGLNYKQVLKIILDLMLIIFIAKKNIVDDREVRIIFTGLIFSSLFVLYPIVSWRGIEGLTIIKIIVIGKVIQTISQSLSLQTLPLTLFTLSYLMLFFLSPIMGDLERLVI